MCYRPLWLPASWHPLAQREPPPFCPLVPTTQSHAISSCQISPIAPERVPARIVPLSVSRHRQLLGRVTPCYTGVAGERCCHAGNSCFFFLAIKLSSDAFSFIFSFFPYSPQSDLSTEERSSDLRHLFVVSLRLALGSMGATMLSMELQLRVQPPVDLTFAICLIICRPSPPPPPLLSSLSTHVLSSVSICWSCSDRKTWCVVISEAWQRREGSYLGPLEKGLGTWWGLLG